MRIVKKTVISKIKSIIAASLVIPLILCGCGSASPLPYEPVLNSATTPRTASFYAEKLCVPEGDVPRADLEFGEDICAGLFCVTTGETRYAKNVYEKINPASLTKIMTALVAIENGDLTKTITASANVNIQEKGAQKLGINEGDRMTLDQALHIMLIYSANDVAVMIAENIAGSVDRFAQLMNERAGSLGATGCHFVNPHGLTDREHYVTAYDLYLIFNEAMSYKEFRDIIDTPQYISSYRTADGTEVAVDIRNTNAYLSGEMEIPEGVTVIGGKTGTTAAAGHCLIMLSSDSAGNEYVSLVMKEPETRTLYTDMTRILRLINE